jgi:hypothetical protein
MLEATISLFDKSLERRAASRADYMIVLVVFIYECAPAGATSFALDANVCLLTPSRSLTLKNNLCRIRLNVG